MADEEKASFLRNSVRAPGKRQVKPTALFYDLHVEEDSEDDKDFSLPDEDVDLASNAGSDGSGDESGEDEDGSGSGASGDDADDAEDDGASVSLGVDAENTIPGEDKPEKAKKSVCAICLGVESDTQPIIKCDRCTITVHESCYGYVDDDTDSTKDQDEVPWFCEPCMFGLKEPPYCEMCPNRFGAFKRTDVGGNWIHVTCSMYIERITYADVEHVVGVSYQEVDFKQFGNKPCQACEDVVDSRTGITVRCEAGLCKNYFHVTCAQRLGLLVEDDHTEHVGHLYCKKHTKSEDIRRRVKLVARVSKAEEERMLNIRRIKLRDDVEQRRRRLAYLYESHLDPLQGVNVIVPCKTGSKRVRLLNSSSEIVNGMQRKLELFKDIPRDEFADAFSSIPPENFTMGSEPAMTEEFTRYLNHRESIKFDESTEWATNAVETKTNATERLEKIKTRNNDFESKIQDDLASYATTITEEDDMFAALQDFGMKSIHKCHVKLPKKPTIRPSEPRPSSSGRQNSAHVSRPSTTSAKNSKSKIPQIRPESNPPVLSKTSPKGRKPKISSPPSITKEGVKIEVKNEIKHESGPSTPLPVLANAADVITIDDDDDDPPPKLTRELSVEPGPPILMPHTPPRTPRKFQVISKLPGPTAMNSGPRGRLATVTIKTGAPIALPGLGGPLFNVVPPMQAAIEASRRGKRLALPEAPIPKVCGVCHKGDSVEMPFCDSCRKFFHLGCLTPPLTKMPQLSRFYKFYCARCSESHERSLNQSHGRPAPVMRALMPSECHTSTENLNISRPCSSTVVAAVAEDDCVARRRLPREGAAAARMAKEASNTEMNREWSNVMRGERRFPRTSGEPPAKKAKVAKTNGLVPATQARGPILTTMATLEPEQEDDDDIVLDESPTLPTANTSAGL